MVVILSPSKAMTDKNARDFGKLSSPEFLEQAIEIAKLVAHKPEEELMQWMSVSEKLAKDTYSKYQNWLSSGGMSNFPALFSYTGEVYSGLKADGFNKEDIAYANQYLRIMSGLYGLLKPMDNISPYRLEMAAKLQVDNYTNLYQFWKDNITAALNQQIQSTDSQFLANLASDEYYKAIKPSEISVPILQFEFYEMRNGSRKFISFNAKRARGLMASFIIRNKIKSVDALHAFNIETYQYVPSEQQPYVLTFVKP